MNVQCRILLKGHQFPRTASGAASFGSVPMAQAAVVSRSKRMSHLSSAEAAGDVPDALPRQSPENPGPRSFCRFAFLEYDNRFHAGHQPSISFRFRFGSPMKGICGGGRQEARCRRRRFPGVMSSTPCCCGAWCRYRGTKNA